MFYRDTLNQCSITKLYKKIRLLSFIMSPIKGAKLLDLFIERYLFISLYCVLLSLLANTFLL